MASSIVLNHVSKHFPGSEKPAVDSLSMEIGEGKIVAFVGPSGCGKTTTLKMINRLVEPTSGSIMVFGENQKSQPAHLLRRQIGYVIQQVGLFPHRTIAENVGTVPRLLGWKKAKVAQRIDELVELVGLEPDVLGRYPAELSGGQQQRIGVARALAVDPPILLMDEPYSAVDPIVRSYLQDELLELQRKVNKTIVVVTHDIDEAIKLGDEVAVFKQGGVLEQYATPKELLQNPNGEFVTEFLGEDRNLRRLGLLTIDDLAGSDWSKLQRWPTVELNGTSNTSHQQQDASFSIVLDKGAAIGWIHRDSTQAKPSGNTPVDSESVQPFQMRVTPDTSLRTTLDGIVRSATRSAVIHSNQGKYLGLVTLEELSVGLEES